MAEGLAGIIRAVIDYNAERIDSELLGMMQAGVSFVFFTALERAQQEDMLCP